MTFLAATGNIAGLAEALRWAGCQEQVFFENVETAIKPDDEGLAGRLKLNQSLSLVQRRLVEAVGIYQMTGDEECIRMTCTMLIEQNLHCVAKMLAYQIKDEELMRDISFQFANYLLQENQPIKAALELITTQQPEMATQVLAISGESILASFCCISSPEETEPLGMYGCAELCYQNDIDPSLLLKLGRGSGVTA